MLEATVIKKDHQTFTRFLSQEYTYAIEQLILQKSITLKLADIIKILDPDFREAQELIKEIDSDRISNTQEIIKRFFER